jgi:hypothetical protein
MASVARDEKEARMRRRLFRTGAVTAAGLATVIAVATQATARTDAAAVTYGPGHWVQVTANGMQNISDVGLARGTDGVLHVLWTGGTFQKQKIVDTPIAANGKPGAQTVVVGNIGLASDPDATVTPKGIDVFWDGLLTTSPTTPSGVFEETHPLKGGHWSAGTTYSTLSGEVTETNSVSAGTGSDGQPWFAVTGTDTLLVWHLGQHPKQIPPTQCCVYDPGIATDGKSGASYVAYLSLISNKPGVWVQKLSVAAASGSPTRLPSSQTSGNVIATEQRIGITGRGHGRPGVFAAYGIGYPYWTSLDVTEVGASKPVKLATFSLFGPRLAGDTISAGPDGRLWTTWYTNNGSSPWKIFVRASGTTGLSFGRTTTVSLPSGTSEVWKVYASAQAGREDIVALITRNGKIAYFATQVPLPAAKK